MPAQHPSSFHQDFLHFLGKAIRTARRTAPLTQRQLAAHIGVTFAAVSQWERGLVSPSVAHLRAIGTAVRIPAWQLLRQAQVQERRP
jgi:transcriptional regulator with XRE-family HTH domain